MIRTRTTTKHITATVRCRSEPLAQIVCYYKKQGVLFESRAKLFEQIITDFAALVSSNFNIPEYTTEEAFREIEQFKMRTIKTGVTAIAGLSLHSSAEKDFEDFEEDELLARARALMPKTKQTNVEGDFNNEWKW